eukprot:TRINITY_DN88504_c0_g1_i1.p1 TRINITY_DN88504_c0_g1~~TRINITY_DN88504_c0_g1_i1.p1  ORF type:complete len:819 (-),score=131.79 TRINITY_DN88504_c0_g1_i1:317-2773(-)
MDRFCDQLLLKYPDIADYLQRGSFDPERLKQLIDDDTEDLQELYKQEEERLAQMDNFYPTPDEVMRLHMVALEQYERNGPAIKGPAEGISTGVGAVSASSVGGRSKLNVIGLTGLRTSAVPLFGTVIGGTIAAQHYRNHATAGAVTTLMRSDDGGLCRVALYNLSREVELGLSVGRRIVVQDVWFKRFKDGTPGLRVDDPATVHFDTTAAAIVDALVSALGSVDPMADAVSAKEEGTAAFRSSDFSAAMACYSRGLSTLLQAGDVRLVDFGISANPLAPPPLRVEGQDAVDLAVALLNNRAAAALKLRRTTRALMDTQVAMAYTPTQLKTCYRRAQALMSVGACAATVDCLAPHTAADVAHKNLSATAEKQEASSKSRTCAAFAAASRSDNTHSDLAYIGPIKLQRLGGRKGRGWVAAETIETGQILIVEPGAQVVVNESSDDQFPLFQSVLKTLSHGGDASDALRDQLSCMHPLAGEAEDSGTRLRDEMVEPLIKQYAAKYRVSLDDAHHFERVVQRNQFGLVVRMHGETGSMKGAGLFPLCSSFNHSCYPNAMWRPLDGALVVISTRSIPAGEEVSVSYHDLTDPGFKRKQSLMRSHGFECCCLRCTAKPGSALLETERTYFGLICPSGNPKSGHLLCPINPYSSTSSFECTASNCKESLSAMAAQKRIQHVHDSFEALRAPFRRQDFLSGCMMAQAALENAEKVIGPSNHEWSLWAAAANGHASGAGNEQLLLLSCERAEAVFAGHCLPDDNIVFMRVNAALVLGLARGELPAPAAQALRRAYEGHVQLCGLRDFSVFLRAWVPPQFHGVCRQLQ